MASHIVFFAICFIICWRIYELFKRRYHISWVGLCYAVLALAIYAEHRIWGPYYTIPNLFFGIGYMDIIMIILLAIVLVFICLLFLSVDTNESTTAANPSFLLDCPIENDADDLLDYKSSAQVLADKIKGIDTKHSCSIGLIAPWGMGKTSYLNILSNYFDKDSYIILRFNPRHSISSDNIQTDFFNLLFSTLGRYDSRFNSTFKDYLKAINIIDNVFKKNQFPDLLAYIESVNIVGFNDISSFERYVDIVMYILGTNRGTLYTNIAAFGLIYKSSAEQVCEKYDIQESEYKELLIRKLCGNHSLYPYQLVRDYLFALLRNEIREDTILNADEIVVIAKESLTQLCEKSQ